MQEGQLEITDPRKDEFIYDRVYQIQACPICLVKQLNQNVVSLTCGHCFHYECIFRYLGWESGKNCPCCRHSARVEEIRVVILPLEQNYKVNDHMRELLSSISVSERKQVLQLLREIKKQTLKLQKVREEMAQCQAQNKRQQQLIDLLKFELGGRQSELKSLQKQNEEYLYLNQNLEVRFKQIYNSQIRLRLQLEGYRRQDKQYQQLKRFQRIMSQNSQEIVNFKLELQKKNTESSEMAKHFYDMLLLKNLDWLKVKERLAELSQTINEKESQIKRNKSAIDTLRKELKEVHDKKAAQRRKYEQLKAKYRTILEKAKLKGLSDIPELDDNSQGFSNTIKPHPILPPQLIKTQSQLVSQKPMFSMASTIGGLRKKDDRQRVLS